MRCPVPSFSQAVLLILLLPTFQNVCPWQWTMAAPAQATPATWLTSCRRAVQWTQITVSNHGARFIQDWNDSTLKLDPLISCRMQTTTPKLSRSTTSLASFSWNALAPALALQSRLQVKKQQQQPK